MVPWEPQDLVVQEVHVGREQHHGVHGEQVVPMDLLDPVTKSSTQMKINLGSSPIFSSSEA